MRQCEVLNSTTFSNGGQLLAAKTVAGQHREIWVALHISSLYADDGTGKAL